MTEYIKQVAEAVRDAALCALYSQDVDLDAIIAQAPKPEPFGYFCQWENAQHLYTGEPGNASEDDWMSIPTIHKNLPLYSYPPDAQAEIDRLKAELEALRASRHYELVKVAGIARHEDLEDEQAAYMVEKGRGNDQAT